MEISIKTNVSEQAAEGYAEFYARHLQKGYYMWILITNPIPVVAIPYLSSKVFPYESLDVRKSILVYAMLAVVMAAIVMVEYLAYQDNISKTTKRMNTFYVRYDIQGELLFQIGDEELLITSENRIIKCYYHHGRLFFQGANRIRKVYECPDILYFLVGSSYFVIPVWNCDPEEWKQICSFLKQTFGNRYICLKKPVFPNRVKENSR